MGLHAYGQENTFSRSTTAWVATYALGIPDDPADGGCNGNFQGYYVSDLINFLGGGISNVDYFSDVTPNNPPENPADSLVFGTLDCNAAGQVCLAEISVNGVEKIDYTPGPGQQGYNANPGDGDVFHFVFSATPRSRVACSCSAPVYSA